MRIGIVVDGEAEYASLSHLTKQVADLTGSTILSPAVAKLQPYAPVGQVALTASKAIRVLEQRKVDRVVVLIDREERPDCCGEIANQVEQNLSKIVRVDVRLVIKDRMFENWLIADPDALDGSKRFSVSKRTRSRVAPNKADNCSAMDLISRSSVSGYEKVADSKVILAKADIGRMAKNSRSFRRFLRCLEHPDYKTQSKKP